MAFKRITVIKESDTGRNQRFRDNVTGREMTSRQFVSAIRRGDYSNYHVRTIGNTPTPVSNPDQKQGNNLG